MSIAELYGSANTLASMLGKQLVGRCHVYGCREWGLRHYRFSKLKDDPYEAAKTSLIFCARHAKRMRLV